MPQARVQSVFYPATERSPHLVPSGTQATERASRVESRVVDDTRKWLSWEQYLGMVAELRK